MDTRHSQTTLLGYAADVISAVAMVWSVFCACLPVVCFAVAAHTTGDAGAAVAVLGLSLPVTLVGMGLGFVLEWLADRLDGGR